ncbi:MAG: UDP-N-acetylglucosamine 2-epimerase (non-hydrolyzing) [Muribaculaceae bacterium]|nr:UDP-N-acetylglucosamine 2-epimerase (non-hydrolyzing) [Muribaculum sp.]MCM1295294.1 UDP-N-acetylglucosamine 2-epimerase (non-hydrolyzing) [Muribaculaceae bacterium]
MITLMLVFGTRPEAIKMIPLIKKFRKHPNVFRVLVTVTGQHRELLYQVLRLFDITPDYDLNIMEHGQDLTDISVKVLNGMRSVLLKESPDILFVHGDTTTTAMVALSGFYAKIPVAHVEAGLRTDNLYNPWPEEANRQLTARISKWHFAPTTLNKANLIKENINPDSIIVTGNTVIDALNIVKDILDNDEIVRRNVESTIYLDGYDLNRVNDNNRRLVLITVHRRENMGESFSNICNAIITLAKKYKDVDFVWPIHPNPSIRMHQRKCLALDKEVENVFLIEPLEYLSFVYLMRKSHFIITDSGGIQEEAPALGVPVLVTRRNSERPEAIESGSVRIIGTMMSNIVDSVSALLDSSADYEKMLHYNSPYGDGTACDKIVNFFLENRI